MIFLKGKRTFLAVLIVTLTFASIVSADGGLAPYLGADLQHRSLNFKSGFGDNLFLHHQPQGNIYLGAQFHRYLGIETGFESTSKRNRSAMLSTGDTHLGVPITVPNTILTYSTRLHLRGWYISLVGFVPFSRNSRVNLMGFVGVTALKASFTTDNQSASSGGVAQLRGTSAHLSQRKTVLRLGTGLEYRLNHHWGLRGILIWENTAKIAAPTTNFSAPYWVKPKNSLIYSVGALIRF